jgi:Methyltransferase domain
MRRFTTRQKQMVVLGPAAILLVSGLAWWLWGTPALLLAPVLTGAFLAWSLIDLRHHAWDLFHRGVLEQRAIYGQLEAILGLNAVLRPTYPFPGTRGWAASPDLLREVVTHVLHKPVHLAVEASSGTSTLMIAYAMERKGSGRVIALEHDAVYAGRTRALLDMHGLAHRADVVHAPLVRQRCGAEELLWYDLSQVAFPGPIDLVVVDGPPEASGPLARYPAVPLLRARFSPGALVILDDGDRPDERAIAERWRKECAATACEHLPLEKGAWSLRF